MRHVRMRESAGEWHQSCTSTGASNDHIMDSVIGLVKKYDKIDARLSFMGFEEEFSIEIPDEKADKLTCCADVAKYVVSGSGSNIRKS
ncbi:hypothetical protein CRYUN_Cryun31cG0001900 [Craigia yunnanensis]